MDNTLQRLLDAEIRAEALVTDAIEQREQIARQALEEARLAEDRLSARLPEVRDNFMAKANQRAEQTISEMKRRFDERSRKLQAMADESREDAIESALAALLGKTQR